MTAKVSEMTDNGERHLLVRVRRPEHGVRGAGCRHLRGALAEGVQPVRIVPGSRNRSRCPCTLARDTTAGSYTTIETTKNASVATGKPVTKSLKTTKAAKMKVTVRSPPTRCPSGKVLVKQGTKTLGSAVLNDAGKATVNMGKLTKGKHKVKVVYKGDGYTLKGASDAITFTIVKP